MSRLLLDTTFLIDVERGGIELDDAIADGDDVAIAAITLAELRVGVRLANEERRSRRSAFFEAVRGGHPVVGYDADVADVHSDLLAFVRRSGTPRGAHDLIIAASARASGREVLTADRSALEGLPGAEVSLHR